MNSVNDLAAAMENNGTGDVSRSIAYCFEDLSVGMTASLARTIAVADVAAFADVTGDANPIHLDEAFAAKTRFKRRIVHGMLYASFLSAAFAMQLPGPGAIYVSQSLRFTAPVYIGDTVTARIEVTGLVPERQIAMFKAQCFVGDRLVLDGEATLVVPRRPRV